MKLKATAAVLSAAALFAACSDEVVNVNDEAKEKATIAFKVVDDYTGEAIEGATVYSVLDDKTKEADELGMVSWKKNSIGNYVYYISAEGYKTIQVDAAAVEMGQGNVARVPNVFQEVRMVKGGVKASGSVLYTDREGNRKAAAKVTVFANCGAAVVPSEVAFVPSEISVVTDETGAYAFEDLPAGATCEISVGQEDINDQLYKIINNGEKTIGNDHRSGDIVNLSSINMTPVTSVIELVSDNLSKVDTATTLKIIFSAKIDKDSLADYVNVVSGTRNVLIDASVDSDGKTLLIKPFSKKWEKGDDYSVIGTVWSVDGATFSLTSADLDFEVGATAAKTPDQVSDLKAVEDEDYPEYYFNLSWTAPKFGCDGFYVFYKTDKMADWLEFTSTVRNSIQLENDEFGSAVKSVEFMVLSYNGNKVADKTKAKTVKYIIPDGEEIIVK